jgi:branched-chain amino acid transport system ATP-binding protein
VTSLCPEISVLHFGRIISKGTPEEVTSDPTVIEAYLGHGFEMEADAIGEGADTVGGGA